MFYTVYTKLFEEICILTVNYNETGETETRRLSFYEDGTLNLAYLDNWIIQYDEYIREENVPEQ